MLFAVLPVKSPRNAKQRLSGFLSPAQREQLARAMFEQVLDTLCSAGGIDRVVVATSDAGIAAHAATRSIQVFEEREQLGHSHSADLAARRAIEAGARSVMLLPIDVPLITRCEIESVAAESAQGVVIVPSSDGTGTNALVRNPPDAIKACFGPGSFNAHCREAEAMKLPLRVMRPPGILFDIDTPEDVLELIARAPESRLGRLLRAYLATGASHDPASCKHCHAP